MPSHGTSDDTFTRQSHYTNQHYPSHQVQSHVDPTLFTATPSEVYSPYPDFSDPFSEWTAWTRGPISPLFQNAFNNVFADDHHQPHVAHCPPFPTRRQAPPFLGVLVPNGHSIPWYADPEGARLGSKKRRRKDNGGRYRKGVIQQLELHEGEAPGRPKKRLRRLISYPHPASSSGHAATRPAFSSTAGAEPISQPPPDHLPLQWGSECDLDRTEAVEQQGCRKIVPHGSMRQERSPGRRYTACGCHSKDLVRAVKQSSAQNKGQQPRIRTGNTKGVCPKCRSDDAHISHRCFHMTRRYRDCGCIRKVLRKCAEHLIDGVCARSGSFLEYRKKDPSEIGSCAECVKAKCLKVLSEHSAGPKVHE